MGWLPRAPLAFTAALGLSGCLLFTDPINEAPVVTIDEHPDPVFRGVQTEFTATVKDEDSPGSIVLAWAEFGPDPVLQGCDWITPAAWVPAPSNERKLDSSAPYKFTGSSLVCLCVQATDHYGASGQACHRIEPKPAAPSARIEDVSGALSGATRPLCSQVQLSAESSTFPAGDQLQFDWSIQYSGSDPSGTSVQLATCSGVDKSKTDQHRCFYAGVPGSYTVTLSITDTFVESGATTSLKSDPAMFVVQVDVDRPPCIQRTDPDWYRQWIFLSSNPELGGTYESRTFKVLLVADDCEPYPQLQGSTNPPARFVWSVFDSTQPSPTWVYQTNTSDTFTVSQALFPNARPGDTIGLRVEVRDTQVQKLYQSGGQVCPLDTDVCCGTSACGQTDECVRWTTWTVQFQP